MRAITKRSELIAGIKNGERLFIVEGKSLLLQCTLASKFNNITNVSKATVTKSVPAAAAQCAITESTLITLAAIAVVGAVAIIAILKKRNLTIEVEDSNGNKGRVIVS